MPPSAKIFIACTRSNKYYSILPKLNSINKLLDLATKKHEAPTSKKYVSLSYQKCLREMWRHHSSSQNLKWRGYTWKQHWNISVSFPKKQNDAFKNWNGQLDFQHESETYPNLVKHFRCYKACFQPGKVIFGHEKQQIKKKLKSNLAYFIICVIIQLSDIIQLLYIEKAM